MVTADTITALMYVFLAAINLFLLWLSPQSMYVLLAYLLTGLALRSGYSAVSRARRRRGPALTQSDGTVSIAPTMAPINLTTVDLLLIIGASPVSFIGVALTRSQLLPAASVGSLSALLDAVTIVLGIGATAAGVILQRGAAYRPGRIHRGPVLTLSPTHVEFHPLLSSAPIRIPWDQAPYVTAIDYPTVNRDVTKRAHITTTASPTPVLIDITCLDLTAPQLQRLIGCFATRPECRGCLAGSGGTDLVRALVADNPAGWPR